VEQPNVGLAKIEDEDEDENEGNSGSNLGVANRHDAKMLCARTI
jgi:hypothetical protein